MKRYILMPILLVIFSEFLLSSCSERPEDNTKPHSIGNTSEIMVVVQNESQWENQIGKAIRNYFGAYQYGLPQAEPIYKLSHVKASSFNNLFQKYRNILIIDIDKNAKISKVIKSRDYWAHPQRIFKIISPSTADFVKIFNKNAPMMMQKFNETERARILSILRPENDLKIIEKVIKQFGLKMVVPQGFYVAKIQPGFMWIRKQAISYNQGLMFFSVPYKDTLQFSLNSIMARTDEYLKKYIPGPTEGSYMTTDHKFVLPKADVVIDFPLGYTVEIRGLWRVEHDFMGGPFVSYTFVDKRKNEIVTIFGYVYQPSKNKRDLLLQVESLIYSAKFQ